MTLNLFLALTKSSGTAMGCHLADVSADLSQSFCQVQAVMPVLAVLEEEGCATREGRIYVGRNRTGMNIGRGNYTKKVFCR